MFNRKRNIKQFMMTPRNRSTFVASLAFGHVSSDLRTLGHKVSNPPCMADILEGNAVPKQLAEK